MLMIRPQRCLSIELIACWVQRYADVRLVLRTASQSARFMRMTNWSRVIPALFTRMSILPNCAITALKVDLICSSSPTSSGKAAGFASRGFDLATSSCSLSWLRAASASVAPDWASFNAQARPMPCDAPVTSATRPERVMNAPHTEPGIIRHREWWGPVGACPERSRRDPSKPRKSRQDLTRLGSRSPGSFHIRMKQIPQNRRRRDRSHCRHENNDGIRRWQHNPRLHSDQRDD